MTDKTPLYATGTVLSAGHIDTTDGTIIGLMVEMDRENVRLAASLYDERVAIVPASELSSLRAPSPVDGADVVRSLLTALHPTIREMVDVATADPDGEWLADQRALVDLWQARIRDAFDPHDPYDVPALSALPSAGQWRPISEAKKDGTPIWGVDKNGNQWAARYWTPEQIAADDEGDPDEYEGGWFLTVDKLSEVIPTYFLPLPEPPSAPAPAEGLSATPTQGEG